jgi:drug/metabolite transporter (DMT)-like permease
MTVLLGVVLLGETITPIIIAGGGLVLLGVVLIQRDSQRAETVTQ